jgi:ankyrin repeat protein
MEDLTHLQLDISTICKNISDIKLFNIIKNEIELLGLTLQKKPLHSSMTSELSSEVNLFLSHLKSLIHSIELVDGKKEKTEQLKILYKKLSDKLSPLPPTQFSKVTENSSTSLDNEDIEKEKHLRIEQKRYSAIPENFKLFLQEIWKYALLHKSPALSTFFSYGWPTVDVEGEKWTKAFIEDFAIHLIYAGIQVYIDQKHSGPGCELNPFMQKIGTSNQVVIFDSHTRDYKLSLDKSGVRYENELIEKYSAFQVHVHLSKTSQQQSNSVTVANAPMTTDYLKLLQWMIGEAYGLEKETFGHFWQECLFKYRILEQVHNVRPTDSNLVKREALLKELKTENKITIIHGPEGTGKTQLALDYVWDNYYYFDAVYWINQGDTLPFRPKKNHLLIIDNVKNYEETKPYLEHKFSKKIIALSQDSLSWPEEFKRISVGELTEYEASLFIIKVLGEKEKLDHKKLIDITGRIPGTLARAVGYIQRNRICISEYLISHHSQLSLFGFNLKPIKQLTALSLIEEKESSHPITFESKNPAIQEIYSYFMRCNSILNKLLNDSLFSEVRLILELLIKQNIPRDENIDNWINCLDLTLCHLKMTIHHLKWSHHFPLLADWTYTPELTNFIQEGEIILKKYISLSKEKDKPSEGNKDKPQIANPKPDNSEQELVRFEEQKSFDRKENIQSLLNQIWKFGLIHQHRPQIVFVSFAFPKPDSDDVWTEEFVNIFIKHLIYAGIEVYCSKDFRLTEFIKKHPEKIDDIHVLVIGTRSREYSKEITEEDDQIRAFLKREPGRRFVIPVQLTSEKHYHSDYHRFASHSFVEDKKTYYQSFSELIPFLCGFGEQFREYWNKKLLKYKVTNNLWHVPSQNNNFVGRKLLLKQMKEHFIRSKELLVLSALNGMGGVGKTQVAVQFVHQHGHQFHHIFWLAAENRERLIQAYIELGEAKEQFTDADKNTDPESLAKIVINWLENIRSSGWLLIIDNAPNFDTIKDLLPSKGGKILITSRHTEWPGHDMQVSVFNLEEGQEYIKRIIDEDKFELKPANELIELLGRLPLALAQACAYIKKANITIDKYIQLYRSKQAELLSTQSLPEAENQKAVSVTWQITLVRMQEEFSSSIELMYFCAYLHNQDIPRNLVPYFFEETNAIKTSNTIRIATEYSMLNMSNSAEMLSIHQVVQEVIRFQLGQREEHYLFALISALIKFDKNGALEKNWIGRQFIAHPEMVLFHLDKFVEKLNHNNAVSVKVMSVEENQCLPLYKLLAHFYNIFKLNYEKKLHLLNKIKQVSKRVYGANHLLTHTSSFNTEWEAVDTKFSQPETLKSVPNSFETMYRIMEDGLSSLSSLHEVDEVAPGFTNRISELFTDVLQTSRNIYSQVMPMISSKLTESSHALDNLSNLTQFMGSVFGIVSAMPEESKAALIRNTEKGIEFLIETDIDAFDLMDGIIKFSQLLVALKDLLGAKYILKQLLQVCEKFFGIDKKSLLLVDIFIELASVNGELGNLQKKQSLLEKCLSLAKQHYGDKHLKVGEILFSLGCLEESVDKRLSYLQLAYEIMLAHPDGGERHGTTREISLKIKHINSTRADLDRKIENYKKIPLQSSTDCQSALELAKCFLFRNRIAEGIHVLNQILNIEGLKLVEQAKCQFFLINFYLIQNDLQAIQNLLLTMPQELEFIKTCLNGFLLIKQKKYAEAIQELNEMIDFLRENSFIIAVIKNQDWVFLESAKNSLDQHLQRLFSFSDSPNLSIQLTYLAYYWIIECYQELQQTENLQRCLQELIKLVELDKTPLHLGLLSIIARKLGNKVLSKKYEEAAYLLKYGPSKVKINLIDKIVRRVANKETPIMTPAMSAAKKGKLEAIEYFYGAGADLEERNHLGFTALIYAARYGHLEIVIYLVETAGVRLSAEDNDGDTALSIASMNGHIEVVRYLHSKGADINHKRKLDNDTPIISAARNGKTNIVNFLHNNDALLEEQNNNGLTALMYAAGHDHLEIVIYLVETAHVNLNVEDNNGNTALHYASLQGFSNVVRYLHSKGCNINYKRWSDMETPLIAAAKNGKNDTVKYLHENGALLEEENSIGFTALISASRHGHLDTVIYLVETAHVNFNAEDNDGNNALSIAAVHGNTSVVQYLHSKGCNINHKRKLDNETPIISAAKNGKTDTVKYLHENDALLEEQTHIGFTALIISAMNGHLDTVMYLVEIAQINLSAEDLEGDTALSLAAISGFTGMVCYLDSKDGDINHKRKLDNETPIIGAARNGKIETVKYLHENGALLEEQTNMGFTVLLIAATNGHLDIVIYLVETAQVNLNAEDKDGDTALSLAALAGHTEVVRYLHSKGCDIHHKRKLNNKTPIMLATENGKTETVKYLHENGALLEEKNDVGYTALISATHAGHLQTLIYLVGTAHVNLRAEDNEGNSALSVAAEEGNLEIIQYLHSQGCDINHKRKSDKQTPIMAAAEYGKIEVVKYLHQEGALLEEQDNLEYTALMLASLFGHLECVIYLIEIANANLDTKNIHGNTAQLLAAWRGRTEVIHYFHSRGYNINQKNNYKQLPIMLAAKEGKTETVKSLHQAGALLEEKCNDGFTVLMYAARHNHLQTVIYLVESAGVILDTKNKLGLTALILAARFGNTQIVECLVVKGANVLHKTNDGFTALQRARAQRHDLTVEYLLNVHADKKIPIIYVLHWTISYKRTEEVKKILISIINLEDLHQIDDDGHTPLHCAAAFGELSTLQLLLENAEIKKDILAKNHLFYDVLHLALFRSNAKEIVQCLLSHGANIYSEDKNGNQVIHKAILSVADIETIKLLIENNADIYHKNNDGKSVEDLAVEVGYSNELLQILSAAKASKEESLDSQNSAKRMDELNPGRLGLFPPVTDHPSNNDSDDDEELALAIAMSLSMQTQGGSYKQ